MKETGMKKEKESRQLKVKKILKVEVINPPSEERKLELHKKICEDMNLNEKDNLNEKETKNKMEKRIDINRNN